MIYIILEFFYNYLKALFVSSIIQNAIGEFLGSLVLALLIYFLTRSFFKLPDISGRWKFIITTKSTDYNGYTDMELTYQVFIMQIESEIKGTGEKIHENSKDNPNKQYVGKDRSQIIISGNIKRSFSLKRKNYLIIHYTETNAERDSSTMHKLLVSNNNVLMNGNFYSTIANQSGTVVWTKDE